MRSHGYKYKSREPVIFDVVSDQSLDVYDNIVNVVLYGRNPRIYQLVRREFPNSEAVNVIRGFAPVLRLD